MRYSIAYIFSNLNRNRGRYLLFGLLFLILSAVWLVCLLLGQAADTLHEELETYFGRAVVLDDISTTTNVLTDEVIAQFNNPELVSEVENVGYTRANLYAFIESDDVPKSSIAGFQAVHMVGYNFDSQYNPFTRRNNPYPLTRGRLIENEDECIVFDDIYDKMIEMQVITGLGDRIEIGVCDKEFDRTNTVSDSKTGHSFLVREPIDVTYTLTVVGTVAREATDKMSYQDRKTYMIELQDINSFANVEDVTPHLVSNPPIVIFVSETHARQYPANSLNIDRYNQFADSNIYHVTTRPEVVFHLRSMDLLPEFQEMVRKYNNEQIDISTRKSFETSLAATIKHGYPAFTWEEYLKDVSASRPNTPAYRAHSYVDGYAALVEPLGQIRDFSNMMSFNMLLLAVALFVILTALNLYARTYEIGVLRCIGMSRAKISFALLLEHTVFLLVALGLGIAVGCIISGGIVPQLFNENYRDYVIDAFSGLPSSIALILFSGLGLSVLATLGAAVYIQRFSPLKILRNRN